MFEKYLFAAVCICLAIILICRFVFPQLAKREPEPFYLDIARSFFPVLLIVFLLRGFIAEPFRIPSGSMLPTLEVGDFILVNKFKYGVRIPILHNKVISVSEPKRGDIMVFRWPLDNATSYIKRVIGLPGDTIEYTNRTLYVNGNKVQRLPDGEYLPWGTQRTLDQFQQIIQIDNGAQSEKVQFSTLLNESSFRVRRSRQWVVPEGHYFMMGDNRDNSADSRSWGFVPDKNIIGQAFFIWFHYNSRGYGTKFSRVGKSIKAKPVEN